MIMATRCLQYRFSAFSHYRNKILNKYREYIDHIYEIEKNVEVQVRYNQIY